MAVWGFVVPLRLHFPPFWLLQRARPNSKPASSLSMATPLIRPLSLPAWIGATFTALHPRLAFPHTPSVFGTPREFKSTSRQLRPMPPLPWTRPDYSPSRPRTAATGFMPCRSHPVGFAWTTKLLELLLACGLVWSCVKLISVPVVPLLTPAALTVCPAGEAPAEQLAISS